MERLRAAGGPDAAHHAGTRVVVVDDDDINRQGMTHLLAASAQVVDVAGLSHDEALAFDAWADVDVVVVDAADRRRPDDQFPGVAVVEAVRAAGDRHGTAERPVVVVVTGHFFDDAVRRRMREARADYFYQRADLADAESFRAAVLGPRAPGPGVPPPVAPEDQFRHGVTDATRVNQAVAYALTHGLPAELAERSEPRSRRWLRLRREFNGEARLTPVTSDGRRPDRAQDLPSLPQISRFLRWATKVKDPGLPETDSPCSDDRA